MAAFWRWRGRFYPRGLAQKGWLGYYADRFQTVEVNNAFYRLPEASTFERWRDATPDDFVIGVKASRYLTHIRRLREPAEPVRRLLDRADHLGHKLGPVLLQLPATFTATTVTSTSHSGRASADTTRPVNTG